MPESQENKVAPIIKAVEPTGPQIIEPPVISAGETVNIEPSAQSATSAPININDWMSATDVAPSPKGVVDVKDWLPSTEKEKLQQFSEFDTDGSVINKLRALKDFLSSNDPVKDIVAKIGGWNIPSFSAETLVAHAALVADGETLSIDEIKALPPEKMGQFMKGYNITSIPSEMLINGLSEIVQETQAKLGWDEPKHKSVLANMVANAVRDTPTGVAQFTGSLINPVSVLMFGYGKAVGSIAKSEYGAKVLVPAIDATVDYMSGKIPKWLSDPIGKTFVWKYGLPDKEQLSDLMHNRIKYIKNWFTVAEQQGHNLYDGLSMETQKLAHRFLKEGYGTEELERMSFYPKEFWKTIGVSDSEAFLKITAEARNIADGTSLAFIDVALKAKYITNDVADIIRNNLGTYMPRFFQIFENPNISKAVRSGKISVEDAIGVIEDNGKFLKRVGGYTDEQANAFNSLSLKEQTQKLTELGGRNRLPPTKTVSKARIFLNSLKKRGDLDETHLKAYGEIETPAYGVAKHIYDTHTAIANLGFFQRISENPAWVKKLKDARPLDWVAIPKDKKFGALSGKWVHPEIANEITSIHRITETGNYLIDKVAKFLTRGNSIWKANHILFSPGTHARNMMFNAILLDMSGTPLHRIPSLLTKSANSMWKKDLLYKEAENANLFGGSAAVHELTEFLPKLNKFVPQRPLQKIVGGVRSVYKKAGDVYRTEEELFKFAKYLHMREQGFSPIKSVLEAKKWLFDYDRVSAFADAARKNPVYNIPFITFTTKVIPRLAETAIKNPFKLYKYKLLIDSVNGTTAKRLGITDAEIKRVKESRGTGLLGNTRDENGDLRWYGLKAAAPWGIVEDTTGGSGKSSIPQALQPGGITRIGRNLFYNKDPYTDKDIYGDMPDKFMKILGYGWKEMNPPINPIPLDLLSGPGRSGIQTIGPAAQKLADGFYASGMLSEPIAKALLAKKKTYYGGTKGASYAILDAIFGFNNQPIQPNIMMKFDRLDMDANLREAKRVYSIAAHDQGLKGTPVGEMVLKHDMEMMQQRYNEIKQDWVDRHPPVEEQNENNNTPTP